jgi:hypothetical protein
MFKCLCADPAEIAVPTGAIVKDLDVVEDFGPRHISGLVDPCPLNPSRRILRHGLARHSRGPSPRGQGRQPRRMAARPSTG